MGLIQNLHDTAKKLQKTIVLPEADDERTLRAAAQAAKLGFGPVVLLGDKDEINGRAKGFGLDLSKAIFRDPAKDPQYPEFVQQFYEMRKSKGVTEDKAAATGPGRCTLATRSCSDTSGRGGRAP